jgi:hypothetical protein
MPECEHVPTPGEVGSGHETARFGVICYTADPSTDLVTSHLGSDRRSSAANSTIKPWIHWRLVLHGMAPRLNLSIAPAPPPSGREGKRRHEAGREREWQRGRRGCGRGGAVRVQFVFFLFCYYRLYFDGGGWSTRACVREAEAKARDFGIGWREIVCQNLLDSVFEYAISIFFV